MEDVVEKWSNPINTVTIGATRQEGGTRSRKVTVGGQSTLPFLSFEGATPNKPAIAMEIQDVAPADWPEPLAEAFQDVWQKPGAWAKKCEELGADLICLMLRGIHPDFENRTPDEAAKCVEEVLKATSLPLIIWGCGNYEKDNQVMPLCSQVVRGENCLLGSAVEKNYKTLVASCMADGHKIIGESPIDINIAKQVNILISEMGFPLENIVIFPTTGALGYGMEYVYSIMERGRLAGLSGDKMLSMPVICTVGAECWKVKEARGSEEQFPEWGEQKQRAPLWEATCAVTLLQAGAEILVLRHPKAMEILKGCLDALEVKS